MQEAKQFPTAFFGFERKSVLDYIYEQDRQAREALEELARRNDVLDRKAAELGDKLAALTAQYQQAVAEGEENQAKTMPRDGKLRRPISPEQPMWIVHIDTWNNADPDKIIDLIPEDVLPYVVFNISMSINYDHETHTCGMVNDG